MGERDTYVAAGRQTYAITPAEAQALDRIAQPGAPVVTVPSQVSETKIDVSSIFEPIEIKEQFSPTERAKGFMWSATPFLVVALLVSLAGAKLAKLSSLEWFIFLVFLFLLTLVILKWQDVTYSSAGLAVRHQKDASKALELLVASNEAVTMAKLDNEDRAHEREVELRRALGVKFLDRMGGE